ncbi:hypothetical protein BC835DRAFT_1306892 [Cytidiella melzeri]|nr:hypothetical protein BC835DRAFT_1306892 [Cytidiella melzeri]
MTHVINKEPDRGMNRALLEKGNWKIYIAIRPAHFQSGVTRTDREDYLLPITVTLLNRFFASRLDSCSCSSQSSKESAPVLKTLNDAGSSELWSYWSGTYGIVVVYGANRDNSCHPIDTRTEIQSQQFATTDRFSLMLAFVAEVFPIRNMPSTAVSQPQHHCSLAGHLADKIMIKWETGSEDPNTPTHPERSVSPLAVGFFSNILGQETKLFQEFGGRSGGLERMPPAQVRPQAVAVGVIVVVIKRAPWQPILAGHYHGSYVFLTYSKANSAHLQLRIQRPKISKPTGLLGPKSWLGLARLACWPQADSTFQRSRRHNAALIMTSWHIPSPTHIPPPPMRSLKYLKRLNCISSVDSGSTESLHKLKTKNVKETAVVHKEKYVDDSNVLPPINSVADGLTLIVEITMSEYSAMAQKAGNNLRKDAEKLLKRIEMIFDPESWTSQSNDQRGLERRGTLTDELESISDTLCVVQENKSERTFTVDTAALYLAKVQQALVDYEVILFPYCCSGGAAERNP